jgi:HPt (histidine-containing phosphotransfer) domain-containing protein
MPERNSGGDRLANRRGAREAAIPEPAIDRAELDRHTFDDRDLRHEILSLFVAQTIEIMALIETGGAAETADLAHRLKGSARAIGAGPLARAAHDLEAWLRAGNVGAEALVACLRGAAEAAVAEARMLERR